MTSIVQELPASNPCVLLCTQGSLHETFSLNSEMGELFPLVPELLPIAVLVTISITEISDSKMTSKRRFYFIICFHSVFHLVISLCENFVCVYLLM